MKLLAAIKNQIQSGIDDQFHGTDNQFHGINELFSGTDDLFLGTAELFPGIAELFHSEAEIHHGISRLCQGVTEINSGAFDLRQSVSGVFRGVAAVAGFADLRFDDVATQDEKQRREGLQTADSSGERAVEPPSAQAAKRP